MNTQTAFSGMRSGATPMELSHQVAQLGSAILGLFHLDPLSRAERQLSSLSDEMLADIGIARPDIPRIVRHGRNDGDGRGLAA